MDYIKNGQPYGSVADVLVANNFDPNALRPYIGDNGRSYITRMIMHEGKLQPMSIPIRNATATLRKDDWIQLDQAIVKVAKPRLKFVGGLRAAGLQYVIPNGMSKTVLQTETQSDITDAIVSMDGLRKSEGDRPEFELTNLPLPIIHKDFHYSLRQIQASRNGGSPLDTTTAELAARRVAEQAEKLALGVNTGITYGGGTIYGITNYVNRLTKTMTTPTTSGWTGGTFIDELLAMRLQLQGVYHFGPYKVYTSPNWDQYLDADYSTSKGDNTLRERVEKVNGFQSCETMDYLTGYTVVIVQQTSDVIRMVAGMEITTLQWDTDGGLRKNFKVMAILVPQIRADQDSNCGICHGTAT